MVRKIRCKVCHYRFVPKAENKKVIKDRIRSYRDNGVCYCSNIRDLMDWRSRSR